ncbi:hypothetical protein FF1_009636 [Malus domestica]
MLMMTVDAEREPDPALISPRSDRSRTVLLFPCFPNANDGEIEDASILIHLPHMISEVETTQNRSHLPHLQHDLPGGRDNQFLAHPADFKELQCFICANLDG